MLPAGATNWPLTSPGSFRTTVKKGRISMNVSRHRCFVLTFGLSALALSLSLSITTPARAQIWRFAPVPMPDGIATDGRGNVWVHIDRTTDHGLAVFRPDGTSLGYITMGGLFDTEGI